ncbi:MAG: hypothetical protein AABY15_00215 [Nanoarchaeota archaeon]
MEQLKENKTYEPGKYYDGLGYYIGIVDTYPWGVDYYLKNHTFRIPSDSSWHPSKINEVLIKKISKTA